MFERPLNAPTPGFGRSLVIDHSNAEAFAWLIGPDLARELGALPPESTGRANTLYNVIAAPEPAPPVMARPNRAARRRAR